LPAPRRVFRSWPIPPRHSHLRSGLNCGTDVGRHEGCDPTNGNQPGGSWERAASRAWKQVAARGRRGSSGDVGHDSFGGTLDLT